MFRCWLLALGVAVALALASASVRARPSAPRVHQVYPGQHLGMIAKRYRVTVDAICRANGLDPRRPIRPGQKLRIPPEDDPDGSRTSQLAPTPAAEAPAKGSASRGSTRPEVSPRPAPGSGRAPRTHRVAARQHLGMIARRYHVAVEAICHASDLDPRQPIRPGQLLTIPWPEDEGGEAARRHRERQPAASSPPQAARGSRAERSRGAPGATGRAKSRSWKDYRRPPWRRGFVHLEGLNGSWQGYVIGKGGKVLGGARQAFSRILATSDGRTIAIHPRLVKLVAKVSDTFGGRPIRVVSGYRLESTARRSRHKTGHALDFSIPGVPNEALRDYVKTFSKVGIGFYPNSHFIHLDVRDRWTYWVDYSGPGQPPRYAGVSTRPPSRP